MNVPCIAAAILALAAPLAGWAQAPAERFATLDLNRDNRITLAEAENDLALVSVFRRADRNGDGWLTPEEFVAALDLAAHRPPQAEGPGAASHLFAELDEDRDGWISRWEAKQRRTVLLRFDEIDRDGNGHLDRDELDRMVSRRSPG